jgi:MFS family permease
VQNHVLAVALSACTFVPCRFGQGIDYVVQCLFVPILSNLSDSYGRRPLAVVGVLGLVVSALFFYLASLTTSVPWYMIATTVQGAFAA